jgi:YtkA-like
MESIALPAAALAFALLASACGASGDPESPVGANFPDEPYSTVASEAGKLSIELRTSPRQPLDRGLAAVLYTITGDASVPMDDLDIAVIPWMPAMAHGASLRPTVSAEGSGRYVIANLNLFMPGLWQLQTSISGAVNDRATPTLEVR